ncbi:translation initiation factor eIF-2B beta subunit [Cladochytrium replicatum]|nr:translation initiation factor eIF-2B beta subunit [Cladochytrium replicatum]
MQFGKWTANELGSAKWQVSRINDTVFPLIKLKFLDLVIGNTVTRVLHLIREEYNEASKENAGNAAAAAASSQASQTSGQVSMLSLMGDRPAKAALNKISKDLKPSLIDSLSELMAEMDNLQGQINLLVTWTNEKHSEIIMTAGNSKTVELFLKEGAKVRKFQVIVAESVASLASAGIDTTVIPDSAVFAVMSRVNKVILGTNAVTPNGSLVAISGTKVIASAAKHHATPVVVCTGIYKLSPRYPYDADVFNVLVNPDPVWNFHDGDIIEKVNIMNSDFDYVPPELISLFFNERVSPPRIRYVKAVALTRTKMYRGSHPPSDMYRLVDEMYTKEDANP